MFRKILIANREFLVDGEGHVYFMETTHVEHPVTGMVTGVDIERADEDCRGRLDLDPAVGPGVPGPHDRTPDECRGRGRVRSAPRPHRGVPRGRRPRRPG